MVLSVTGMLVDLSVAIIQVIISVAVMLLVVSMPRSGCSALHGVNPNLKKIYGQQFLL